MRPLEPAALPWYWNCAQPCITLFLGVCDMESWLQNTRHEVGPNHEKCSVCVHTDEVGCAI